MGANSNWNPLDYFRELHVLPRTIFSVGWLALFTAIATWQFVLVLGSVAIIFLAVSLNFFLNTWGIDPYVQGKRNFYFEPFWQALLALVIGLGCLYVAAYRYRHSDLPSWLKPSSELLPFRFAQRA
jgi:hypothetical protein